METIELGQFRKTRDRLGCSSPYTITFVYCPDGKSFCVKGMSDEVENYVKTHFPICLYYYSYWENGVHRGAWRSNGCRLHVSHLTREQFIARYFNENDWYRREWPGRKLYHVWHFDDDKPVLIKTFRRMPRKWLPEYNVAL